MSLVESQMVLLGKNLSETRSPKTSGLPRQKRGSQKTFLMFKSRFINGERVGWPRVNYWPLHNNIRGGDKSKSTLKNHPKSTHNKLLFFPLHIICIILHGWCSSMIWPTTLRHGKVWHDCLKSK